MATVDTGVLFGILLGAVLLVLAYLLNDQQKMMWSMLERLGSLRPSREQSDTSIPESIRLERLNDSVWEVCKPSGSRRPSLEIVFFSGLQPEFSNRPEVTAWLSRDKSELWLNWLRDENPDIRILVVSHLDFFEIDKGRPDFRRVTEDILHDLTAPGNHFGNHGCPVILVGHCLGGLVLKEVCVQAQRTEPFLSDSRQLENIRSFLDNVKGIFFFATPHLGLDHPKCRIAIAKVLSPSIARINETFHMLRAKRKWKVAICVAAKEVSTGNFKGLIVHEASARYDADECYITSDDHFSICRPESRESASYQWLSKFLSDYTALKDELRVTGTRAKVFFCGNECVGKTTLINSLLKAWGNLTSSEGSERQQLPRTRGIEVSYVEEQGVMGDKPLTLALWDLAGQHEYEVLHSSFLPDLALADAPATFFVIVCSANMPRENDVQSAHTREEDLQFALMHLLYWLQFISSNSLENVAKEKKRKVLVVLNCFKGNTSNHDRVYWECVLGKFGEKFERYLDLYKSPLIFDATSPTAVTPLKVMLNEEARRTLQNRQMPKICFIIQDLCRKWAQNHKNYPVLSWEAYSRYVNENLECPSNLLVPATDELHETGHLILLPKRTRTSLTPDHVVHESLVILDPEWLCKSVVGYVLLPQVMVEKDEANLRLLVGGDGSIPMLTLSKTDLGVLIPGDKLEEAVGLLVRLGLCYTLGSQGDRIFIPALIEDNVPTDWSSLASNGDPGAPQEAWVMGFSLVLKNSLTTLLSVAPLRRLQVELAERWDIGGRRDCKYTALKSCITFKSEGMDVLVQYITSTRLDVLVKPFGNHGSDFFSQKRRQVELAQEMVDKFLEITNTSCPGVELERRIIKPWSVQKGYKDARARNIELSVELVAKGLSNYQKLNWTVVGCS